MIAISDVRKTIDDKEILKGIRFKVNKGSIFGLIGPNGAGKSTLIKCLMGIYRIDDGSIRVDGEEVFNNAETKMKMAYVADLNDYFDDVKVKNAVEFYKRAYSKFNAEKFDKINEFFKIPLDTKVKKLSKGMKTRLAIMLNLSSGAEVIVLDEPTSGLDPIIKRKVLSLLMEEVAENNTTILISSHNLSDIERICDDIAILDEGSLKYSSSIENMKDTMKKYQVVFKEGAPEDIKSWENVCSVTSVGKVYYIVVEKSAQEFTEKLQNYGVVLQEEIDMTLEDMFIYSVGGEEVNGSIF